MLKTLRRTKTFLLREMVAAVWKDVRERPFLCFPFLYGLPIIFHKGLEKFHQTLVSFFSIVTGYILLLMTLFLTALELLPILLGPYRIRG